MSRSSGQIAADIILHPLPLLMMGGMFYMLFLVIKAATARNPQSFNGVTASGGRVISVKATFTGVRRLPWPMAIATNNATPLLIIGQCGIEYRVINKRERAFKQIEQIDVRQGWRTVNLEFQFCRDVFTLAANVGTLAAARAALALFPADVPMTAAAEALLRTQEE